MNDDQKYRRAGDRKWLARLEEAMAAVAHEHDQTWGDIDENLMAAYVSGVCSEDEKTRVERAMREHPAVKECIEACMDDQDSPRPQEGNKGWSARMAPPNDSGEKIR